MRTALAILSVIVLAIHGFLYYDELSARWQEHQDRYFEQAASRSDNPVVKASLASREPAIEQVIVRSFGSPRVDRCTTCHIAVDDPRFAADAQPLKTHPPIPGHKFESFGCTICHQGQGRAVDAEAAHEGGHDWPWPLAEKELIEANCVQCHTDPDWPHAPRVAAGRKLFFERACYTCHTIAGLSYGSIGPELTEVGMKRRADYIRDKITDPRATNPTSTMPKQDLTAEQVLALTAFLEAQQGSNVARAPLASYLSAQQQRPGWLPLAQIVGPNEATRVEVLPAADKGAALLPQVGCLSCHKLGERDGRVAPDLAYTAAQRGHGWLIVHFRDPKSVVPGSLMPPYPLPEEVFDALSSYLSTQPPRLLPNEPAALYAELCARCHGPEGKGDGVIASYLDPRPRDLTKGAFMKTKTRERLLTALEQGVAGTSMAPWGEVLGAERSAALIDYVLATFPQGSTRQPKERKVPTVNPVPFSAASVARGQAIFLERCWGCHGKKADGHGPNADEIVPRPRNLRNAPFLRSVTYARLHESIKYGVQGTAMPAAGFDFALTDEQIGDLLHYIYDLNGLGGDSAPTTVATTSTAR
ncbi:MAG: c-type cytochrome [Thermoanaerobaculia bacterium]|nr:c-type cytochrome [Thermoanaerobaculia bacterium]